MLHKTPPIYFSICKTYFPKWDPWDFTYKPKWGSTGYCNKSTKHIFSGSLKPFIIIHEICHAISITGHTKIWQKRMIKTAITARNLNDIDLFNDIVNDVLKYLDNNITTKQELTNFYNHVEEAFQYFYTTGNNESKVDLLLTNLINEFNVREEWDYGLFKKMKNKGLKIAASIKIK